MVCIRGIITYNYSLHNVAVDLREGKETLLSLEHDREVLEKWITL